MMGPGPISMRRIVLDASGWKGSSDFYDALLPALGAPDWHGRNLNALLDSLSAGDINEVEPPFLVEVLNTGSLNGELKSFLREVAETFGDARNDRDADVAISLSA